MKKLRKQFVLVIVAFILIYLFSILSPWLKKRNPNSFHPKKVAQNIQTPFENLGIENAKEILQSEFHYIGHGLQSIAFADAKDEYVLKIFLIRPIHGKKLFSGIKPLHVFKSYRKNKQLERKLRKQRGIQKVLKNYAIVYEKHPQIAALVAIHPNAKDEHLPIVSLFDDTGKEHLLDLNFCSFVIQKKANLILSTLQGSSKERQESLTCKLHDFLVEKAKQGFYDKENDLQLHMNYGFVEDQPIQLDVGKVEFKEELLSSPDEEVSKVEKQLQNWLKKQHYNFSFNNTNRKQL